ncbi:MAG: transglutaminase-like domain-containing protein [Flavobacteriales bacterium]|nr:transglutaminase-like domain-containing protein [Flavobacteriales bacterium]
MLDRLSVTVKGSFGYQVMDTQIPYMYSNEVNALITLIEDPDEEIYNQVRNELKNYGESIIPQLEHYWELQDFGPLFQTRLEELISSIQYDGVYNRLKNWKNSEDKDLLEGALIINKYQYPSYDEDELKRIVSRIRQDIWLELNDNLTAFEQVRVLNHILFSHHGFKGNRENYHQPQNSFLTDILATKSGNPLSLGLLYCYLAKSLDLPIHGVNLPSHFILCYLDFQPEDAELGLTSDDADVMFYINPFNSGAILHREEIDEFLEKQNLPRDERFYRPCANMEMISRMLNNLIHAYIAAGNDDKVRELRTMQSLLLES